MHQATIEFEYKSGLAPEEVFSKTINDLNLDDGDHDELIQYLIDVLKNSTKGSMFQNVSVNKMFALKTSDCKKLIKTTSGFAPTLITEVNGDIEIDALYAYQLFNKHKASGIYDIFMRVLLLNKKYKPTTKASNTNFGCIHYINDKNLNCYKFVSGDNKSIKLAKKKLGGSEIIFTLDVKHIECNIYPWMKYYAINILLVSIFNEFFKEQIERETEINKYKSINEEVAKTFKKKQNEINDKYAKPIVDASSDPANKAEVKELKDQRKKELDDLKDEFAAETVEVSTEGFILRAGWKTFKNYTCDYKSNTLILSKNIEFADNDFITKVGTSFVELLNEMDPLEAPKTFKKENLVDVPFDDLFDNDVLKSSMHKSLNAKSDNTKSETDDQDSEEPDDKDEDIQKDSKKSKNKKISHDEDSDDYDSN